MNKRNMGLFCGMARGAGGLNVSDGTKILLFVIGRAWASYMCG